MCLGAVAVVQQGDEKVMMQRCYAAPSTSSEISYIKYPSPRLFTQHSSQTLIAGDHDSTGGANLGEARRQTPHHSCHALLFGNVENDGKRFGGKSAAGASRADGNIKRGLAPRLDHVKGIGQGSSQLFRKELVSILDYRFLSDPRNIPFHYQPRSQMQSQTPHPPSDSRPTRPYPCRPSSSA